MKKNTLFSFIIILFVYLPINAQNTKIDSLKIELGKAQEDTNKVNLLCRLADENFDINNTQTRNYAQNAYNLSAKINFTHGKVYGLNLLGLSYYVEGDYIKATEKYKKALTISNKIEESDLTLTFVNLANIYSAQSENLQAIKYYLKALKIYEKNNDENNEAMIYMNLALEFKIQNNFEKALEYNFKALKLYKNLKDDISIIKVTNNTAGVYLSLSQFQKSKKMFLESLKRSEEISFDLGIANSCLFLGIVYQNLINYNESIKYIKKSIQFSEKIGNQFQIAINNANLGKTYMKINDLDNAIKCLNKSNVFFINNKMIHEQKDIYLILSEVYEKQKNYKNSLIYYKKFKDLEDDIYNETNSQQINEALTKYETEKKEKEIIVLNADLLSKKKDKVILEAKIEKRNSIIFGTIIGSILLIITIILLYNRKRLLLRNLHQLEINQQRDNTTAAIVQAQEKEQTRIAKDLHDSIGTFLSTLKINLQLYEENIPENKSEGYQNALNLIDKISVELRNIMKNLSNETLQDHGLVKAFEEVIGRINELELTQVDFHTNGVISRLDESIEHNLYRISQELLNNCIKHAKAEHATIQLIEDDENITLMFEDDGVGFDVDSPLLKNKNHGMGVKNIYNRVEFIKGTIRIESSSKNGSVFIIEVPKK
jgi:two-component system, NarL family, sensor kinase